MTNWKKSFRKLPAKMLSKLEKIESDLVLVAASKTVLRTDIDEGVFAHLEIQNANLFVGQSLEVLPQGEVGRTSLRNLVGEERMRKDLPKITKTYTWEFPIFGDGARNGYAWTSRDREVYRCDYIPPQGYTLHIEVLEVENEQVTFKFQVGEEFDTSSATFANDLLFAINLLQENTGVSDVHDSDVGRDAFLRTQQLSWDVFPPENLQDYITHLKQRRPRISADQEAIIAERIGLFNELNPIELLVGLGGNSSYIGARYADDLVVFENMSYGNALYILYKDWAALSQLSRTELLRGHSGEFDRIVHKDGWQELFRQTLKEQLTQRGLEQPQIRRRNRRRR